MQIFLTNADSYDLSREVAAVSLSLFDRYMATRGNRCDGEMALLTSLTSLYIAVKTHASHVKMSLSTLANLSRGQYSEQDIQATEWKILGALEWKLHPPTTHLFVKYMPPLSSARHAQGRQDGSVRPCQLRFRVGPLRLVVGPRQELYHCLCCDPKRPRRRALSVVYADDACQVLG